MLNTYMYYIPPQNMINPVKKSQYMKIVSHDSFDTLACTSDQTEPGPYFCLYLKLLKINNLAVAFVN